MHSLYVSKKVKAISTKFTRCVVGILHNWLPSHLALLLLLLTQVLHFVDETHSASLHAAKGLTFPGKDSVHYVPHDCGFVAHVQLDQMQF